MKRDCLIVSVLLLGGCMASNSLQYEATAETNQYHIARLRKGMSEKEALRIMHKPYSYESFQVDDDIYDVWFYVTRTTGLDQTRMVPQNLTPITFKNGVLVGMGYYWYYYAMKSQAEEMAINNPPPPKKPSQDEEDKAFEKALKTYPKKPASSATPQQTTMAPPKQTCHDPYVYPSLGMDEGEVTLLMGEPARKRAFKIDGDFYDVWFYETAPKTGKPSIVPQKATPYIFKNALLVSTSDEEYFQLEERVAEHQATLALQSGPKPEKKGLFSSMKPGKKTLAVSQKQISKLELGMSPEAVQKKLGEPAVRKSFSAGKDFYEVWFYDISTEKRVPLTFKNNALAGTTPAYYKEARASADTNQVDGYDRDAERGSEDESEQNFDYW